MHAANSYSSDIIALALATPLPPTPTRTFSAATMSTPTHTPHLILPEFWPKEPVAWFRKVEAQFNASDVSSSLKKYQYVITKLPADTITQILDLLTELDSNTTTPYECLKERLLTAFVPSRWSRAQQLLNHPPLGDQRPSALMATMLAILPPEDKPDSLFLTLFLNRMPQTIREHLASRNFTTPREMAAHADQLWEARPPTAAALAALAQEHRRSPSPQPRGRSQNCFHKRSSTPHPSPQRNNSTLCYYHQTFGAKANKCESPCTWVAPPSSQLCFYHQRFGARAHKCEPGCSWTPLSGNSHAAGGTFTN